MILSFMYLYKPNYKVVSKLDRTYVVVEMENPHLISHANNKILFKQSVKQDSPSSCGKHIAEAGGGLRGAEPWIGK